ncbi:MAG: hypothetical protein D3904_06965 [Candidatus Electrothrix sp. EH2]|nr:hypothetical protein [Candidatus Electrothrix sp. EH2]
MHPSSTSVKIPTRPVRRASDIISESEFAGCVFRKKQNIQVYQTGCARTRKSFFIDAFFRTG